ncbi:Pr6Pr family membrane protein [Leifsonia poae]|uniref:Pr6Pr family membrane protein n=1 Tax=Leifsonia poae TaxID=110933 RepID=UPI001CBFC977|nr:Pr6Pr family membrane protein [Leifsonia poae]
MSSRSSAVGFRMILAVGSLAAMVFQLFAVHIPKGYSVFNFFTYFTNLSNILISVVFIISALRLLNVRRAPTPTDSAFRGAAVVYIAFVGLVFNTLLRDADLSDIDPVVNVILHFALPIAGVVDWLLWPPMNRLRGRVILWWMIFPAVYAVFSIVRGAFTGIYPYPFFNPDAVGGYGAVTLYCLTMVAGFLLLAFAVRAAGNWRHSAHEAKRSATNAAQ